MKATLGSRFDAGETVGFDYIRILLALAVMLWHAFLVSYGRSDAIAHPGNALWVLPIRVILPLFFALSGFLVTSSLVRVPEIKTFVLFRVLRIAPALVVETLLSAFILGPMLTSFTLSEYFTGRQFFSYLANMVGWVHFFLPGVYTDNIYPGYVNQSLWTVPFELECYLVLVLFFMIGIWNRLVPLCMILLAAALYFAFVWDSSAFGLWVAVPGRFLVASFVGGIVVFHLRHRLPTGPLYIAGSLILSILVLMVPDLAAFSPLLLGYTAAAMGCTNPRKSKMLRSGDYSYGLYLYSFPIQQALIMAVGPRQPYLIFGLSVVASAAFAYCSWHYVEKPTLQLKNRFRKKSVEQTPPLQTAAQVQEA